MDLFKERYSRARLSSQKLTANHGDLYCADSKDSGIQLAYYLLEKYLGQKAQSSRARLMISLEMIGYFSEAEGSQILNHE